MNMRRGYKRSISFADGLSDDNVENENGTLIESGSFDEETKTSMVKRGFGNLWEAIKFW